MENKKILGFMVIHYSGDYLKESLLSIVNHVDKMVVAYSQLPSQGFSSKQNCPDSREYILTICQEVLGNKLIWNEAVSYHSEAYHRDVVNQYTDEFDYVVVCDSDEIMTNIPEAIEYAENNLEKYFGMKFYKNFFRSFSWICLDGFRPIRLIAINRNNTLQNLECPLEVLHFSCCQRREIMEYKYSNFGHASEIRPNYLEDIFYKWTPDSGMKFLHPVSLSIWEKAEWFDKSELPAILKNHPNFNKLIIE